ncbi:hypothetical protein [Paralcaligenes ureilyticus]|uniref:hypothetical protein n=1 Tax=Paralcaligenes ureilyticus TaxID=627131 RepID=UPI0010511A0C|nr:hypothetical protein [Paralcaligenes ureilyticus]
MSPQETTASSGPNLIGITDLLAHRGDLAATLGKVAQRPSLLGLRLYGGLEASTPNNIDCAKVGVLNPH